MVLPEIKNFIEGLIADSDIFLVDIQIKPGNLIRVYVDKPEGISIEECVSISRKFQAEFDRDKEDYDLQVSSPGLEMPLKVEQQFKKYLNRGVQVIMIDGEKYKGELAGFDDQNLTLSITMKVKKKGSKKKSLDTEEKTISRNEIKAVKVIVSFK